MSYPMYFARFADGFRIAHNADYCFEGNEKVDAVMRSLAFSQSQVYQNETQAYEAAVEIGYEAYKEWVKAANARRPASREEVWPQLASDETLPDLIPLQEAQAIYQSWQDALSVFDLEQTFIHSTLEEYEDDDMGCMRANHSRIRITVKEMIDKIREDEDFGPSYVPDNLDNLQSTFLGLADGDWIIDTNLYTIEQMEAMDRAEERRECEQAVAEVCQQYDLTPGTTAFFTKLEELIEATYQDREDFNSYDRRAEMFMDHRFAGGGSETYYDDLNYTNSEYSQKMEKLSTALEWAQKCCPLLWMQYEESKLSNTKLKEAA